MSDLGNATLNPSGALFYNMGIIFTAIFLGVFAVFAALSATILLRSRTTFMKPVGYFGFTVTAMSIVWVLYNTRWFEWLLIASFLSYIGLLAYGLRKTGLLRAGGD